MRMGGGCHTSVLYVIHSGQHKPSSKCIILLRITAQTRLIKEDDMPLSIVCATHNTQELNLQVGTWQGRQEIRVDKCPKCLDFWMREGRSKGWEEFSTQAKKMIKESAHE